MSAVAIAAAIAPRESWQRVAAIGAMAAMAPDLDGVPGLLVGFGGSGLMAHRGLTHSVCVAVAGAACLSVVTWRRTGMSHARLFIYLAVAMVSHGVLDTFSNFGSGIGVALLSPLSPRRFNAPWQPIRGELSEFAWCLVPLIVLTVGVLRLRHIRVRERWRARPVV
jgi:membrane-bound metal-dependent hydrolase YbcI (DUF457 family)